MNDEYEQLLTTDVQWLIDHGYIAAAKVLQETAEFIGRYIDVQKT